MQHSPSRNRAPGAHPKQENSDATDRRAFHPTGLLERAAVRAALQRRAGEVRHPARADRQGHRQGSLDADDELLPRHPLRRTAGRRSALASAAAGQALEGRARCDGVRGPLRAAPVALWSGDDQRGLPVPERLRAEAWPRPLPAAAASRHGVDPRRRALPRRERRLRPDPARGAGRRRGDDQLPAGPARLPRPSRADRGVVVRRLRQLRNPWISRPRCAG